MGEWLLVGRGSRTSETGPQGITTFFLGMTPLCRCARRVVTQDATRRTAPSSTNRRRIFVNRLDRRKYGTRWAAARQAQRRNTPCL